MANLQYLASAWLAFTTSVRKPKAETILLVSGTGVTHQNPLSESCS
jgi:hypothetical protein